MSRTMQEVRRMILGGAAEGGRRFIVKWRHWPVLFCRSSECRHVYSLVAEEEATIFDSPAAAGMACSRYGLKIEDCEILTV